MRTFTETEAMDLLCPMCFNNSDDSLLLMCVGNRCVAFTLDRDYRDGDSVFSKYYCAAMPGNRQ